MAEKMKGIIIDIGAETSGMKKAFDDIKGNLYGMQKELKSVNTALKFDPKNTTLLAQKQKLLADESKETASVLAKLKETERKYNEELKNGKQPTEAAQKNFRELQREIAITEAKYESLSREASKSIDKLADKKIDGSKLNGEVKKIGSSVGKIALGVSAGVVATGAAVGAIAENTREYREDINRLETAFEVSGKTAKSARDTYNSFYSILGESDRSVEAVNHLAKLCQTEEELAKWSDICAGVSATFGDSLPIEGLTEASNETAKTGKVTGVLADALNWVGLNEEKFNDQLKKCNSEKKRSELITDTLGNAYKKAGDKFRESNEDIIASRNAAQRLDDTLAEVGDTVEPIITTIKNLASQALEKVSDWVNSNQTKIESAISAVTEFGEWVLNNMDAVTLLISGVAVAFVGWQVGGMIQGIVTAITAFKTANEGATIAQWAINAAMSANPIGIVIVAITALVTAVALLWQKNEGFRNFCIACWEAIKTGVSVSINAIKNLFISLVDWFKKLPENMLNIGKSIVEGIWNGITGGFDWICGKISEWCGNVLNFIKQRFGINSPAKTTIPFGAALVEGMAKGIEKEDSAKEALQKKCTNLLNILKEFTDSYSLEADLAKGRYELWEAQNPEATEEEKLKKQNELLTEQIRLQEYNIKVTNDALWEQKQLTGEDSEESRKLEKELLAAQTEYYKMQNNYSANSKSLGSITDAEYKAYTGYKKSYGAILRSQGYSEADIERSARKSSGYTGVNIVNNYNVPVVNAVQNAKDQRRWGKDIAATV